MRYVKIQAKTREEALEKSGLRVGQLARITELIVSGNTSGEYTVHPTYEPLTKDEIGNLPLTDIF